MLTSTHDNHFYILFVSSPSYSFTARRPWLTTMWPERCVCVSVCVWIKSAETTLVTTSATVVQKFSPFPLNMRFTQCVRCRAKQCTAVLLLLLLLTATSVVVFVVDFPLFLNSLLHTQDTHTHTPATPQTIATEWMVSGGRMDTIRCAFSSRARTILYIHMDGLGLMVMVPHWYWENCFYIISCAASC